VGEITLQSINTLTVALLLAAAVFLIRSFFSPRIGDGHVYCRKCHYDLFGLASTFICPECGSDLQRTGAMVDGFRKMRPRSLVAGLLLLMAGSVLLLPATRRTIRAFDSTPYMPTWWLVNQIDDPLRGSAVMSELQRRLERGSISSTEDIVQRILAGQADSTRSWNPMAGDFVVTARASGKVSDAAWERFVRAAVSIRGSKLPTSDGEVPLRLAQERGPGKASFAVSLTPIQWKLEGHPEFPELKPRRTGEEMVPGSAKVYLTVPQPYVSYLAGRRGSALLRMDCDFRALPQASGQADLDQLHFRGRFDVVLEAANRPQPPPIASTPAESWFKTIQLLANDPENATPAIVLQDGRPVVIVIADPPPADVAMQIVFIDPDGSVWPFMPLVAPRGEPLCTLIAGSSLGENLWRRFHAQSVKFRIEYTSTLAQWSGMAGPFLAGAYELPYVAVRRPTTLEAVAPW
jgi:hypothetical protein